MPTIYYRTEDPIENLKIRVVVREVSKAKIFNEDGTKVQPFYNEVTLSWQQKLYSPREISNFLRNKENRGGTAAQVEARRHFAKLEKDGNSVDDMLEEVMMYTYVDKDNFRQETPPPLFDPSTQEPYLGAAVRTLGSVDNNGLPRQKALSQRLFRDKPFKAMYICLATDVNEDKLKEPESFWDSESHFNEHILCGIRLYKDGLIEVTPSFSSVIEEAGLVTHDESSGLGVFIDDLSAETGLKKGFRLSTFRVRSAKGSEFEYAIQNVNDVLIPYKFEQIEAKKAFVNSIKAAEVRGSVGSGAWMQDPPSRDKTVGIYAEIVSGRGFEGDKLFLTYEVTTPQNWLLRTGDLSDGVSNVTQAGNGAISAEQREQKLLNTKARTEGDEGMLQGVTHTASVSHSMRTATTLPFHRPRWKGIHLAFPAGGYSRVIVGMSFFGISCLSVIVGASYPFWIVPALFIVFVLGTGMPGPPPQVVLLKRKSNKTTGVNASSSKYAPQASQGDYGSQDREIVGELEPAPVAVFNHLMRFSFDVNDVDPAAHSTFSPSAHMPTLVFQVFSTDWLGRHKLEGYGFQHLSDTPGSCDLEVRTWKPVGGIRDQMVDLFLGNAVYLRDEHFVDSVNKTAAALNRFGVLTQSAGSVRLRVQTIVTDPRTIEDHYRETAEVQQQQDSTMKVKRTVNDILKSFKATMSGTNSRMMSVSNSAASINGIAGMMSQNSPSLKSGQGGERPSVLNIMSTLNATARDAKLQEILARARAKTGQQASTASSVGIAGIAAARPKERGGGTGANAEPAPRAGRAVTAKGAAALDRLKLQLPNSNFNAEPVATPASAAARPQATPSTPSHTAVGATIDTPFANEPLQQPQKSYDPFIEKGARPGAHKKVPSLGPLSGIGANASNPAPSRATPVLAPVTDPGNGGAGSGRGGPAGGAASGAPGGESSTLGSSATSTGVSGPSTARPAGATPVLTARGGSADAGAGTGSVPTTARKGHRYDPKAASEDDAEASEALLGSDGAVPVEVAAEPGTPFAQPSDRSRHSATGVDGSGDSSDQVGMFGAEEEEQPEDAPLLSTLRK